MKTKIVEIGDLCIILMSDKENAKDLVSDFPFYDKVLKLRKYRLN